MNDLVLARARAGDPEAFAELTAPHRRELQLHCYRIVGSAVDSEDLVQEALLAAWRGLPGFRAQTSVRSWLYRIATSRSLNALRDAARRPQEELRVPAPDRPQPTHGSEPSWVEPYPDSWLEDLPDHAPGPEARYEVREAIELAFIVGLQSLPPLQRAALVLRDVLGFRTAEVADILDTSDASVKSALQRARSSLEARASSMDRDLAPAPHSPREQALTGRFAAAFEAGDIDGIVELLTDGASLAVPQHGIEYRGRAACREFMRSSTTVRPGRVRLVATRANTQPAFGGYLADAHAPIARAIGMFVLTLEGERISAITGFPNAGLFPLFGLVRSIRL